MISNISSSEYSLNKTQNPPKRALRACLPVQRHWLTILNKSLTKVISQVNFTSSYFYCGPGGTRTPKPWMVSQSFAPARAHEEHEALRGVLYQSEIKS